MLRAEGISVNFGGVLALDDVGLSIETGQITGLIGPNGAGKTTLFNVITGLQTPNAGQIYLEGPDRNQWRDITRMGPRRRARLGIGRTFQRLEIFASLSARDNVMVALESHRGVSARANRRAVADQLLAQVGLTAEADTPADVLPTGTARLLEFARALACAPKVLLLDEPSSGLDGQETARLGELLLELAEDGIAVLLVEHDMELVMRVCAHIHVLDFGRLIAKGSPEQIRTDPVVQAAYLGTENVDGGRA